MVQQMFLQNIWNYWYNQPAFTLLDVSLIQLSVSTESFHHQQQQQQNQINFSTETLRVIPNSQLWCNFPKSRQKEGKNPPWCGLIIWVEACAGYSTGSSDFAYPWSAFCCALWSNIWRADKNPSVASKQLRGLTLSKRGFLFPYRFDLLCIFYWAVLIPQRRAAAISRPKCIWRLINTGCMLGTCSRDTCEREGVKAMTSGSEIVVFDIQRAFHLSPFQ